jgi:hypothetical protein
LDTTNYQVGFQPEESIPGYPKSARDKPGTAAWWRLGLLLGLFLAALILIRVFDLSGQLLALRDWLRGPWFLMIPFVAALLLLVPMVNFARRRLGTAGGPARRRRHE